MTLCLIFVTVFFDYVTNPKVSNIWGKPKFAPNKEFRSRGVQEFRHYLFE
jgi:hypothetical protein